MNHLTTNKVVAGKFIKASPDKLRLVADQMDRELRESPEVIIEVSPGIVFYFEKETTYGDAPKMVQPEKKPEEGSNETAS